MESGLLGSVLFIFYLSFFSYAILNISSHQPHHQQPLHFPTKVMDENGKIGVDMTINIKHCYNQRATALVMKNMLETYFPGVRIMLENQLPIDRIYIRAAQVSLTGMVVAAQHFTQMHLKLRLLLYKRWLQSDALLSMLKPTDAFQVYFNGELIFSKLKERRLPTEFELRELAMRKVPDLSIAANLRAGVVWI